MQESSLFRTITDEELRNLNYYEDGRQLGQFRQSINAQRLIRRILEESHKSIILRNQTQILGGTTRIIRDGKFYLQVEGETTLGNLVGETIDKDISVHFELISANPLESLPEFPQSEQQEIINLLSGLDLTLLSEEHRPFYNFLVDNFEDMSIFALYRDGLDSMQRFEDFVGTLQMTETNKARLLILIYHKINVYQPSSYSKLGKVQTGFNSNLNALVTGQISENTLALNNIPINSQFITGVTGPSFPDNKVLSTFKDLLIHNPRVLIISGHGGSSTGMYRLGENFGGNETLAEIIDRVKRESKPGDYSSIVIAGCNPSKEDLGLIASALGIPIFYSAGVVSSTSILEYGSSAEFFDPISEKRVSYSVDLLDYVGIRYDSESKLYVRK